MASSTVSLKKFFNNKAQILFEALFAFLFIFSFLLLLQYSYFQAQKEIQQNRLSTKKINKAQASWFNTKQIHEEFYKGVEK